MAKKTASDSKKAPADGGSLEIAGILWKNAFAV
jgi:hypothetical protein